MAESFCQMYDVWFCLRLEMDRCLDEVGQLVKSTGQVEKVDETCQGQFSRSQNLCGTADKGGSENELNFRGTLLKPGRWSRGTSLVKPKRTKQGTEMRCQQCNMQCRSNTWDKHFQRCGLEKTDGSGRARSVQRSKQGAEKCSDLILFLGTVLRLLIVGANDEVGLRSLGFLNNCLEQWATSSGCSEIPAALIVSLSPGMLGVVPC